MASPAQRLSMGPWSGGLTLLTENSQVDAENDPSILLDCTNLDVTNEGYLVSRPGCQGVGTLSTYSDGTRSCRVLGSIFENGSYQAVLGIVINGTSTKIYLTADGYTLQYWGTVNEPISSVQQYTNTIYLIRSDNGVMVTGGFTIPVNFFTSGTANAATGSVIPSGDKTFLFKDRLFIVNKATSTIYFSAATNPIDYTVGAGGGSFIVSPSNDVGTAIFDVALTNETFYIFKRHTTYLFAYDANPNNDGVLRLINAALGGFSATVWENDVYVVNAQGVYRIVNGVFIRLDTQLDLRRNADLANIIDPGSLTSPLFIHASGDKLLVGYFPASTVTEFGFDYVSMNLTNGAWSGYKFLFDSVAPGGAGTTAQKSNTWGVEIYPNKDRQYFSRIATMRGAKDYTLDGEVDISTDTVRYQPIFSVRFPSYSAQLSSVWKKLHRMFIRGKWKYVAETVPLEFTIPDVIVKVIYDDNLGSQDTIIWNSSSPWETTSTRPQSEFKVALKQHRFRNITVSMDNKPFWGLKDTYEPEYTDNDASGSGYSDIFVDTFAAGYIIYYGFGGLSPNTGKQDPQNEFYLTGLDMDISVPRGMSTV